MNNHECFINNSGKIYILAAYDVMKAIRNMEPAWETFNGRNFALVEYKDKTTVAIRDGGEQNYRSGENARNPCVYCGKHGVFTFTISPRSSEKRGKLKEILQK